MNTSLIWILIYWRYSGVVAKLITLNTVRDHPFLYLVTCPLS